MSDKNKIPLYDYQERIIDGISRDILNTKVELEIENQALRRKLPIIILKSPLGSGKTRMMSKIIKNLSLDPGRNTIPRIIKYNEKDIYQEYINNDGKTSIFIAVPVSILSQWKEELDL